MRFSSLATLLSVALLAATPACGDDDDDSGQAGQAGTSAGTAGTSSGSSGASGHAGAGAGGSPTAGAAGATGGSAGTSDGGTAGGGMAGGGMAGAGTAGGGAGGTTAAGAGPGGSTTGGGAGAAGAAAGSSGSSGQSGSAGTGGVTTAQEMEPNDGATLTEVNPITPGVVMQGSIGAANDSDIFKVATTPGKVYEVRLVTTSLSPLEGHLSVFDAGRNGKSAGQDYIKIATSGHGTHDAVLRLLAMGEGGYLLAVRDERNVPKASGYGGPSFSYLLSVEEHAASEVVQKNLPLPGTTSASLGSPGDLHLYPFTIASNQSITADLTPTSDSFFARMFVFSSKTGDWVARNGNDGSDPASHFDDVPLQPAGDAFLVVENVNEEATSLGYTLTTK